jgi:hypothetical protein
VATQYGADWDAPSLYDVTVNFANLSIENSARALVHMAQLPDFQETPASHRALADLLLASRCRLAIAADPRTSDMNVKVRAEKGAVSVTYQPWQSERGQLLPGVLEPIEGLERLVCTAAATNIMFVGESFAARSESVDHLVQLAQKWNAAVEMVQLLPHGTGDVTGPPDQPEQAPVGTAAENGGILEDTDAAAPPEYADEIEAARDRLIQEGAFGGFASLGGGPEGLMKRLARGSDYSLVVVGDVFRSKGEAVRKRQSRELVSTLAERFRLPVIGAEELKSQYLAGARQWLYLLISGALFAGLYVVMFSFQQPILDFLSKPLTGAGVGTKLLIAVAVFLFIPTAASIIGGFWKNLLKLLRME